MASSIAENAARILAFLAQGPTGAYVDGPAIAAGTNLPPEEINDAVTVLVEDGHAEWQQFYGTNPYSFGIVGVTARGRYEYERAKGPGPTSAAKSGKAQRTTRLPALEQELRTRPPLPIGSPYGFTDQDWELVAYRKSRSDVLFVVFGHQIVSEHHTTEALQRNVEEMFRRALNFYNASPGAIQATLDFRVLGAGYGEHLFNEIARDIISADIAVFDTSELNPNVMLEFGVALTWGTRVLPIRKEGCPPPPSDVSGQTWAQYQDSGAVFPDPHHRDKLGRMVERAVRKKVRG